jgi:hypothetical protein
MLVEHPGARIVVSSYLLAPVYFQTILENAGADGVLSVRARVENDCFNKRLRHDRRGPAQRRAVARDRGISTEYLGHLLPNGPASPPRPVPAILVVSTRGRKGCSSSVSPRSSVVVLGTVPTTHTDFLTEHGSARPRTTTTQKLMMLDTVYPRDENSAR